MAFSKGYVFGFAATVCVVCSLALSGVSMGLREKQDQNRQRDLQKNILNALGLPEDGHPLQGEEIDTLWAEHIEIQYITPDGTEATSALDQDGDGDVDQADVDAACAAVKNTEHTPKVLSVYLRKDGGKVSGFALPMMGVGLWGPLSGYLALDPKGTTVTGTTFFAPKETPGLGAEITTQGFKDRWKGKSITDRSGGTQTIRVVKGKAKDICPDDLPHCVDGVSGATLTSVGVDDMVASSLDWYAPYLKTVRGGAQ